MLCIGKIDKTTCVTASSRAILTRVSESHYKTSNQKSGYKIISRKRCTAAAWLTVNGNLECDHVYIGI